MPSSEEMLREQLAFYRAGAEAFDRWLEYKRAKNPSAEVPAAAAFLPGRVRSLAPLGDVLEIAAGTGRWTSVLATISDTVTGLDASPESLAIARRNLADASHVAFVDADVFEWKPERQYDTVFFADWLAHVPADYVAPFWTVVAASITPDGRVIVIDQLPRAAETYDAPREAIDRIGPALVARSQLDPVAGVSSRRLVDGRIYRVIARYYDRNTLATLVAPLGWEVEDWQAEDGAYLATLRQSRDSPPAG